MLQLDEDLAEEYQASPLSNEDKFELKIAEEREAFFNCLSKEEQLLVFCEVVNRIVNGTIYKQSTMRGLLHNQFGFDHNDYYHAKVSGFETLHASISPEPMALDVFACKVLSLYGIEESIEGVMEKIKVHNKEIKSLCFPEDAPTN